ncbi:MAG: TetR/AcrR family transcriptional regulator [Burkholderiaceae bacterium]|nr:TetR/AcrR family transcriptional regulator [Burkholderiaceae bacterium]MDO9090996.1 TetR/AcrR family transcriptional regulator [Burkholderiaceae bacterium]
MKEEIKEYKRAKILDTALRLFSEQGFSGTSMEAVAEALGVTKPFIYTYFDNKYALLTAIYEQMTDQLVVLLNQALDSEGDSPDRQLAHLVEQLARINMNSRIATVFLQEEKHLDKKFLEAVRRREKEFDHRLSALIRKGADMGVFQVEDPSVAGLGITGMVRWIHRWYQPGGRLSADDIARLISRMALDTLRAARKP